MVNGDVEKHLQGAAACISRWWAWALVALGTIWWQSWHMITFITWNLPSLDNFYHLSLGTIWWQSCRQFKLDPSARRVRIPSGASGLMYNASSWVSKPFEDTFKTHTGEKAKQVNCLAGVGRAMSNLARVGRARVSRAMVRRATTLQGWGGQRMRASRWSRSLGSSITLSNLCPSLFPEIWMSNSSHPASDITFWKLLQWMFCA